MKDWVEDNILNPTLYPFSTVLKDQVEFDAMMSLACFARDMESSQANSPQLLSYLGLQ